MRIVRWIILVTAWLMLPAFLVYCCVNGTIQGVDRIIGGIFIGVLWSIMMGAMGCIVHAYNKRQKVVT